MNVVVGTDALVASPTGSAVTVGTFDGVHLGHRALIAQTIAAADAKDLGSVVLTWDRHPNETLRPERTPPLLTSAQRKLELLSETGVDTTVVLPFDKDFSVWPPERFVQRILVDGLAARHVFVGHGWRFGHKAAGDVPLLEELGREANFEVTGVDLATYEGERVSSRRVRSAIADGDVELAAALLGRPFDVDGIVEHGDDRGAALGFPTANLAVDPALARPPRGVYGGRGRAAGAWHPAATNVGYNPTFGGDESSPLRIETFLLDFAGDLYDQSVRVEFWARLRDEETFDGPEELIAQMKADVEATRALVGG